MVTRQAARPNPSYLPARPTWPRMIAAAVLMAHGLVHLMGPALLWRIGEPGSLRYGQVRPAAGSTAALVVGVGWLAAALLFATAGVLLVRAARRWLPFAVAASLLSAGVIAPSVGVAGVGLFVDAAVLTAAVAIVARRRRAART